MACQTNLFGDPAYAGCRSSVFDGVPPVSESTGNGLLYGIGAAFAVLVPLIAAADRRVDARVASGAVPPSELFSTGGRSIRLALSAAVICAQWIWGATLFIPPATVYAYGVSGPFWYGSGSCVQLALMGFVAYQLRRLAPKAHTLCEVVHARWGAPAHAAVTLFVVVQNLAIAGLLLQTGGEQFEFYTGVARRTFYFVVPALGAPVVLSGLRGVMVASYVKGAFIFAGVLALAFGVYASGDATASLGSASKVYDHVQTLQAVRPNPAGAGGAYLTFQSHDALVFGCVNFFSGFAALWTEQNFWQYGLATRTRATNWAFLWGAALWMVVPWAIGTAAGLGGLATAMPVSFPELVGGGAVAGVAEYLYGPAGSALVAAMLVCAVSSGVAGEVIALSTIVTYDVAPYFAPRRMKTERARLFCLWGSALAYSVLVGASAMVVEDISWNDGFKYTSFGVTLSPPVAAVTLALTWRGCTAAGALASIAAGVGAGLTAWCVTARALYGEVSVATLGAGYSLLAGSSFALVFPFIVAVAVSLAWPGEPFDWASLAEVGAPAEEGDDDASATTAKAAAAAEDGGVVLGCAPPPVVSIDRYNRAYLAAAVAFTTLMMVAWPALTLPAGAWSEGYFTFYVAIVLAWLLAAAGFAILGPPLQYRAVVAGVAAAARRGVRPAMLATPSGKLRMGRAAPAGPGLFRFRTFGRAASAQPARGA